MHGEVITFVNNFKARRPTFFNRVNVLDVGSADINGTNRQFFTNFKYTGVDIFQTKNVDIVCPIHEFPAKYPNLQNYDVVISTEMLEHDNHWQESMKAMHQLVKKGGLLLITCATNPRRVHGSVDVSPKSSPATNDYYHNVGFIEFSAVVNLLPFIWKLVEINSKVGDLRFVGIKG